MNAFTHAMVEGINAKLAEIGEVAWPSEKIASAVCYEIAQSLDGPESLPAEGLNKESALMIAQLLKEANDACIAEGGVTKEAATAYLSKTASDVRDIASLASEVAGNCMLKAAADTLVADAGGSGDNTLAAAAASGDVLAKLDLKNRPQGSYNAGRGETAMPTDVGQVGVVMPHEGGPAMGDVPNSLDIKMAQLANIVEHIKTARSKTKGAVDAISAAVSSAKDTGRAAAAAAKGHGEKATGAAKSFAEKHKTPLVAAGGAAVGAAGGFAAGHAVGKKKDEEKIGMAVLASLGLRKAAAKTASYEETVMRGFYKIAADHYLTAGLTQLKVASPDQLDPNQLRMLADYIEQHLQEDGSNVDLGQMDPELLAALHGQGQHEMAEDQDQEQDAPPAQMPPQMPPQMKQGSVLDRIKRAAEEGGMAGETEANTLGNAAEYDALSKLDKKNRPDGKYNAGLGQTTLPNEGQVGHSEVVAPSESPKNTVTTELKSASLSDEQRAYVAQIEKMAQIYGDQLPTTLNRVEKVAALKAISGMPPVERPAFIASLR